MSSLENIDNKLADIIDALDQIGNSLKHIARSSTATCGCTYDTQCPTHQYFTKHPSRQTPPRIGP